MRRGRKPSAPYAGISLDKSRPRTKPWRARVWLPAEKRELRLGNFRTAEDAARAYDAAVREHRPDLAPNFPEVVA
jgi:hypothetical protein